MQKGGTSWTQVKVIEMLSQNLPLITNDYYDMQHIIFTRFFFLKLSIKILSYNNNYLTFFTIITYKIILISLFKNYSF